MTPIVKGSQSETHSPEYVAIRREKEHLFILAQNKTYKTKYGSLTEAAYIERIVTESQVTIDGSNLLWDGGGLKMTAAGKRFAAFLLSDTGKWFLTDKAEREYKRINNK